MNNNNEFLLRMKKLKINILPGYEEYCQKMFNDDNWKLSEDDMNDGEKLRLMALYCGKIKGDFDGVVDYYKKAIDKNNITSMFELGNYFWNMNYIDQAIYYLDMACNNNCVKSIKILVRYYKHKNEELYVKYLEKAVELNINKSMYELALHYSYVGNIENMLKYYKMSAENGLISAYFELGIYYGSIDDYDEMKKYLSKGADMGDNECINKLAMYYDAVEKNYVEAVRLYNIAIANNYVPSMYNLAIHHKKVTRNKNNVEKYLLMAIEHGDEKALNELDIFVNNDLYYYVLLKKLKPNKIIRNVMNIMERMDVIVKYNRKVNVFKNLNNYKRCLLCHEDNILHITMECQHEICINCYPTMKRCVYNFCKM